MRVREVGVMIFNSKKRVKRGWGTIKKHGYGGKEGLKGGSGAKRKEEISP